MDVTAGTGVRQDQLTNDNQLDQQQGNVQNNGAGESVETENVDTQDSGAVNQFKTDGANSRYAMEQKLAETEQQQNDDPGPSRCTSGSGCL